MKIALTAFLSSLILSATACAAHSSNADDSGSSSSSKASKAAAAEADRKAKEAAERKAAILAGRFRVCTSVSKQLDDRLNELNSRLSVGLPFADYSKAVGDLRVAYDRMFKTLGKVNAGQASCLTKVLIPLEDAMNEYVAGYNTWNDCINDDSCSMEGETLAKAQRS
jgi:hypothetical protein